MNKFGIERFWTKVKKTSKCWIWTGKLTPDGYGRITIDRQYYRVHRLSWYLTYHKQPKNFICHKCNNPPCVRPDHLYDGTAKENTRDAILSGRLKPKRVPPQFLFKKGNTFGRQFRKLTFEQAQEIRKKYGNGKYTQRTLSEEYKVCKMVIHEILAGETYLNP